MHDYAHVISPPNATNFQCETLKNQEEAWTGDKWLLFDTSSTVQVYIQYSTTILNQTTCLIQDS